MSFKEFFKPDKIKLVVSFAFFITGVLSGKFYILNVLVLNPLTSLGFGAFLISLVLDFAIVYIGVCIVVGIIKEVSKSSKRPEPQNQQL